MKRNMIKTAAVTALVMALCLLLCTACGKPKVTGVKSLVAANVAAQAKAENYQVDGDVDMDITLDEEEVTELLQTELKLPVEMTLNAKIGQNTGHVTTEAGVNIMGQSVTLQNMELYMDMKNKAAYTKSGESGDWTKAEYQEEKVDFWKLAGGTAVVGKMVLENAVYTESDDHYSLTLPAEEAGGLIADLHLLDRVDLGLADIRDITVEDGDIIYNVDKDSLLVSSIQLKDVDVRGRGTYEEHSVDLKFPLNADFQFSRYNELDAAEYTVPEEIQ